jgi:AcrR family transcriptional regulator
MTAKVLPTDPIQEQLIAARRTQILDAATTVFAEKGFQRATIRDVAKAAGVADGTIYNYFDSKTALLFGILDRLNETERREADFSQLNVDDWRGFWRSYFRHRLDVIEQAGLQNFQVLLSEVMSNPEIRERFMTQIVTPTFEVSEPFFQRLVDEGKLKPVNLKLALRIFTASFIGAIMLNVMGDMTIRSQWEELSELMTSIFLDGIAATQGDK